MEAKIAVVWIRDGVLVDRMPENAVAFAIASWQHIPPKLREGICIEDLINYGFYKSGVSAAEKMRMFYSEHGNLVADVTCAFDHYAALAVCVGQSVSYFAGAVELLRDLNIKGINNYITSAVDQDVLDCWRQSAKGIQISGHLTEILGKRPGFSKGNEHFDYIRKQGATRIYYVADAICEIQTGTACKVYPIGFANVITPQRVVDAFKRVREIDQIFGADISYGPAISDIDPSRLILPDAMQLEMNLKDAGARSVVGGGKESIMSNLRDYLAREGIL